MEVLLVLLVLGIGVTVGYYFRRTIAKHDAETAEAKAEKVIAEAKDKYREIIIEAKNKSLEVLERNKQEEDKRRKELLEVQRRLEKREAMFDQKLLEFENNRTRLAEKEKSVDTLKEDLQKIKERGMEKLEKIAGLTKDEAKQVLINNVESEVKDELYSRVRKLERQTTEELEEKSKHILSAVIERCATSHSAETTTTTVTLPNDEMKGRIIGKEGRNIKTIEQLTGTELIVDETPGTIWVSGFSPIRRQVARVALEKLMADGRIHPGRIEEAIEAAKKDLSIEIKKAGEDAMYTVGVGGLDPKLVQILGRLKYRTSYGHNVLQHSIEVSLLSGLLAQDLGADVAIAKKGGLLHDIGKAVDHDVKGGHPEIGYDIMKKFGLPEEIAKISLEHHQDHPETLEGVIVKTADAISGARPGARKDTYEQYIQRLDDLENTAKNIAGVEKVYAIQAGRELRVFVQPNVVDDWGAKKIAREVADKIEQDLKYPGEIRVLVIRESRVEEYAR
ncbi:MAG TPA: ribonuclease Y [Patescibacteria group bacterium]|nr:ribonuclease Y [Patescibacteria group bacterium]